MINELITLAASAVPVSEIKATIPLALGFGFSPLKAYVLAFIGNGLAVLIVMAWWQRASAFLMQRFAFIDRLFNKIFERTRRRHGARFEQGSLVALAGLVALPLPLTGGYTGVLAVFLFDLPFWPSYFAILVGMAVSGLVVLGISLGVIHFI